MSHTPGPLDVVRHNWECCGVYAPDGRRIAKLEAHEDEDDVDERATFDARIFAAAPDLLAALRGVMELIDSGALVRDISHDGEPGWPLRALRLVQALKAAQDAIAAGERGR